MPTAKAIYNNAYNSGDDRIGLFIAFCIEQYAHACGMTGADTMRLFADAGLLEYLQDNYEALHSENPRYLIEDLAEIINNKTAKQ